MATVATAIRWRRHDGDLGGFERVRLGLLLSAGVVFVPWAIYRGLLVP